MIYYKLILLFVFLFVSNCAAMDIIWVIYRTHSIRKIEFCKISQFDYRIDKFAYLLLNIPNWEIVEKKYFKIETEYSYLNAYPVLIKIDDKIYNPQKKMPQEYQTSRKNSEELFLARKDDFINFNCFFFKNSTTYKIKIPSGKHKLEVLFFDNFYQDLDFIDLANDISQLYPKKRYFKKYIDFKEGAFYDLMIEIRIASEKKWHQDFFPDTKIEFQIKEILNEKIKGY